MGNEMFELDLPTGVVALAAGGGGRVAARAGVAKVLEVSVLQVRRRDRLKEPCARNLTR